MGNQQVAERTAVWQAAVSRSMSDGRMGWPLFVFATSVLVTLLFWAILPSSFSFNESSDYATHYEPVARSLLAGNGFTIANVPATRYPPGYPMLLAAVFGLAQLTGLPEGVMLSIFILLCVGSSSVLVYLLSSSIWGPRRALISPLAFMTYPFFLWTTKQPNSEIPFILVLLGAFLLFWRALAQRDHSWRVYLGVGLLAGFAMLIRPAAIGLGLVMALLLWVVARQWMSSRARLLITGMLLLGNAIAVLPWEAYVYLHTNTIIPLSTGGVSSMRDGLTFAVNNKSHREQIAVPEDVAVVQQSLLAKYGEMSYLGSIATVLSQELASRPIAVLKLFLIKAVRSWYATDTGRLEAPSMLIQLVYLSLVGLGSLAAWRQKGSARLLCAGVLLVTLYFWFMTISVLSILRYMLPAMCLLFTLLPALLAPVSSWTTSRPGCPRTDMTVEP
jgi:4-amino-4-deoxy-L-arabinose transferase-like glycosyltransferase